MRFGVCCGADRFELVKSLGYDYIETGFNALINKSEEDYEKFAEALKKHNLKIEACNGFFAADAPIVGPNADHSFLPEYVEKGMKRAKALGCEVVVLGSGKARNIPEDFDRETGIKQFCDVLEVCGNIAAKYGIKIAIEPLNTGETNLINTVADCLEICNRVNNPNVGALADFFHVFKSGETLDAIENAKDRLFHVHLARANADRQMPTTEEDREVCKKWAAALKKCGYDARMSLEGSFKPDFTEVVENVLPALELFR